MVFLKLKRTCNFVKSTERRRTLYLTLVRSLFEHCPYILRPSYFTRSGGLTWKSAPIISKFSKPPPLLKHQKCNPFSKGRGEVRAMIVRHIIYSYSSNYYLNLVHCKQIKILPIKLRFDFHGIKMFYSIIDNGYSCVKLPAYLKPFEGSRLRRFHLDNKCYVRRIRNSPFFYRTYFLLKILTTPYAYFT